MAGKLQNEDHKSLTELTGAGGSASQLLNDTKIYVTAGSINKQLSQAITDGDIGGSGGGIEYIANGNAESATTGWSTFADGSSYVDGTGGSPTATFTRSTSSPLRGAASFLYTPGALGNGASYAFTIASADQAKLLTISLDYLATSYANYTDGDIQCFIYDVTNSQIIQPSTKNILKASGTEKFTATFQTSSNSTSYRFSFYQSTSTTSWTSMKLDTISIGPKALTYGSINTEWTAYTPTTGSFGTITDVQFYYQRVGDTCRVRGSFLTGTVAAGLASVNLPSGLSVDAAKIPIDKKGKVGDWAVADTAGSPQPLNGNDAGGILIFDGGNGNGVYFSNQAQSSNFLRLTANAVIANGARVSVEFDLPVTGWSSTTVLASQDAEGRVIAAKYTNNAATALTGNTTNIDWSVAVRDTHGAWSGSVFTAPVPGFYNFVGSVAFNASVQVGLYIYVDGTRNTLVSGDGTTSAPFYTLAGGVYLNAGQTASIRSDSNATLGNSATNHTLFIERVSGNVSIAASETIAFAATRITSDQTAVAGVDLEVVLNSVRIDTHGAFSSSTGRFTAPAAGKYRIYGAVRFATGGTAPSDAGAFLLVNGTGTRLGLTSSKDFTAGKEYSFPVGTIVNLLAGEYVSLWVYTGTQNVSVQNGSSEERCYLTGERI